MRMERHASFELEHAVSFELINQTRHKERHKNQN